MTQDKTLDAAINSFVEHGYSNITAVRVASAAGISRGSAMLAKDSCKKTCIYCFISAGVDLDSKAVHPPATPS